MAEDDDFKVRRSDMAGLLVHSACVHNTSTAQAIQCTYCIGLCVLTRYTENVMCLCMALAVQTKYEALRLCESLRLLSSVARAGSEEEEEKEEAYPRCYHRRGGGAGADPTHHPAAGSAPRKRGN